MSPDSTNTNLPVAFRVFQKEEAGLQSPANELGQDI
jgi:hypothetical protein